MTIDVTAVARVLGIEAQYEDMRSGSILNLPMRIAVLAQGSSDSEYDTTKYLARNAAMVGARQGYGSPAHLAMRELLPANGGGVGTIPVYIHPLANEEDGVAAEWTITPSGTQTKRAAYRLRVNNILSAAFLVAAGASVSARCAAIQEAVSSVLEMPVTASLTYGTVTSSPGTNTGNGTVTVLSAQEQPTPGVYTLRCNTAVANGGVFDLIGPDGRVLADNVTMTPGPLAATVINVAGLRFTLTDGSTDFAVNDSFSITVPATTVVLTAKWPGSMSNAIRVAVDGEDYGTEWDIEQTEEGLINPGVQGALAQIGSSWVTIVINTLEIADTAALDAYQEYGETRWGQLVRKPLLVFTGNTEADFEDATAVCSARRDDRINGQLVSPGSDDLPFVVAARQVVEIAKMANNNPPTNYGGLRATSLTPGADGVQWDYGSRDLAVKRGSSTIEVRDGVVTLADVVTFYRPTGEEPPGYRHVVDIIKVMNIIFNIDLEFAKEEWAGAPLIPNEQPTNNPRARKPKSAIARLAQILDNLGLAAIISDPARAKKTITANISTQNAKRLDAALKVQLAGNTDIIDISLAFGFFFGTQSAA